MSIFTATFIIISIAFIAMATGVLLGRPPMKGSCGGLNKIGLTDSCSGACLDQEKCAK